MRRNFTCFILLLTLIPNAGSQTCKQKTESGEVKDVCCADTEANGNGCIACSKGYTSTIGHSCRPCPNNSYGERCANDCKCPVFHICDHVKGCVEIPTTTGNSVHTRSDYRTYPWTQRTPTQSKHDSYPHTTVQTSDGTSLNQVLNSSSGGRTENTVQGLLSREIIVYYTLSVTVVVLGICLCFIFYKYKAVTKNKKATIIQSQNPSPTQNSHNIELEERLYDIIDDADLIEDQQLKDIQMSPDYLDVISGSNSTGSGEGKTVENRENNFESLSTDQIKMLVNKVICSSLNNRESTSSSGEDRPEIKQDYLNPYQSVIKTSPPNIREYLTLATVHNGTDSMVDNKSDIFIKDGNILQNPTGILEIGLRRPYEYENSSISVEYAIPRRCCLGDRGRTTKSCETLNQNGAKSTASFGNDNKRIISNKDNSYDYYNVFKTKSESDVYCKHFTNKK